MNDIGLIGLGVIGSNLILNIYDNYSKNISVLILILIKLMIYQ